MKSNPKTAKASSKHSKKPTEPKTKSAISKKTSTALVVRETALVKQEEPEVGQFTRTKRFCVEKLADHCRLIGVDPNSIRLSREFIQALRVLNEKILSKAFQVQALQCRQMGKQTFSLRDANVRLLIENGLTSPELVVDTNDVAVETCKQIMQNINYASDHLPSQNVCAEDITEYKKTMQVLFSDPYECVGKLDGFLKMATE